MDVAKIVSVHGNPALAHVRTPEADMKYRFLERPKWMCHPRITQMQAWTQDFSADRKTAQLICVLEYHRRIQSKKQIQKRDHAAMKLLKKYVRLYGAEIFIDADDLYAAFSQ